jgi:hypothetical protein
MPDQQVLPLPADPLEQPAAILRIGSMIKELLVEARSSSLDEAGRDRLRAIHAASIRELEDGLAPELCAELDRLALPFGQAALPSGAELRIPQAQLIGWLEGLFQGIELTLLMQQSSARAQLEGLRGGPPSPPVEFPRTEGPYL